MYAYVHMLVCCACTGMSRWYVALADADADADTARRPATDQRPATSDRTMMTNDAESVPDRAPTRRRRGQTPRRRAAPPRAHTEPTFMERNRKDIATLETLRLRPRTQCAYAAPMMC